jgi:DNA gyrase/topoisomerase IV subunit B
MIGLSQYLFKVTASFGFIPSQVNGKGVKKATAKGGCKDVDDIFACEDKENVSSKATGAKSVEETYQKLTQLEHVLLRPDTYIGSTEQNRTKLWVFDEGVGLIHREVTYVPGLYKIFDEILVNAADNKQRDKTMDTMKVTIDPEANSISVYNNGQGIPVEMHRDEKCWVPELIFGHLLTSSNYNDNEKKTTGGRNGYGAKLANIFSTEFTIETADGARSGKKYKQVMNISFLLKIPILMVVSRFFRIICKQRERRK